MTPGKIAFIGGGNMARSLIGGLLASAAPQEITVAEPDANRRRNLQQSFGVAAFAENSTTAKGAELLVLAVKPPIVHQVAIELRSLLQSQKPLIISIAAGVREPDLRRWLGYNAAIVRCMPNTPALVQSGISALFANAHVSAAQRDQAESVLRAVGSIIWVEEEAQLDAVTALSGSGPAYFFAVMEALEAAGVALGLPLTQARLLTVETAFGAAKMALESQASAAELRAEVTSKGGTTEAALQVLQAGGLAELFRTALFAAEHRARQLGAEFGDI